MSPVSATRVRNSSQPGLHCAEIDDMAAPARELEEFGTAARLGTAARCGTARRLGTAARLGTAGALGAAHPVGREGVT